MATRSYKTTNEKLLDLIQQIDVLIGWAQADAQHARESDADGIADDDLARASYLSAAKLILESCWRPE
jgi:hypothetical protein